MARAHGWNVVATMRAPEDESELTRLDHTLVTRLDVQDIASIDSAVAAGLAAFGRIDSASFPGEPGRHHRQRLVDGRTGDVPPRRALPQHEVRGGGG